jgi:hypothetical protein
MKEIKEKKNILLINGKKRSGKDFISDLLIKECNFIKFSIASSLKKIACEIAGISYEEMEDLKNNNKSFKVNKNDFKQRFQDAIKHMKDYYNMDNIIIKRTEDFEISDLGSWLKIDDTLNVDARKFLQNMNIFKFLFNDENIWINLLYTKILKLEDEHNIIISDFRFPNEYTALEKLHDFKITAIKIIGKNLYDVDQYDTHKSETSLNDWEFNYHINNTIWDEESINSQLKGLIKELDIKC